MSKLINILLLANFFYVGGIIALGVTDGNFELDGNAVKNNLNKTDWDSLTSADKFSGIISDPAPLSTFYGGGSKDIRDISSWKHRDSEVPDKDDITNSYAFAQVLDEDLVVYFGSDRFANDGDAAVGFWFLQDNVIALSNGRFSGIHRNGDLLVIANYGSSEDIFVYEWVNGDLVQVSTPQPNNDATCQSGSDQIVCAITNSQVEISPWPYVAKSGLVDQFPPSSFLEGGINLRRVFQGRNIPCFTSFLAVTRSSSSLNAQLKDFVLGRFDVCSINITLECNGAMLNEDQNSLTYSFQVEVKNTGFGELFQVDIHYDGDVIASFPILEKGETKSANGTFVSTELDAMSGMASVFAAKVSNPSSSDDYLFEIAEADDCPVLEFNPEIWINKTCEVVLVNVNGYLTVCVMFNGMVCNVGDLRVGNITVTDNSGTMEMGDDNMFHLGTLFPGECIPYNSFYFPQNGTVYSDNVMANALPSFGLDEVEAMASATCSLCP